MDPTKHKKATSHLIIYYRKNQIKVKNQSISCLFLFLVNIREIVVICLSYKQTKNS